VIDDLEYRIAKVNVGSDDTLVIKVLRPISSEMAMEIKDHVRGVLGGNTRVLVLGPAFELSVITAPADDEAAA
jgi:hypothetical protein